jgi:hypothetical protein
MPLFICIMPRVFLSDKRSSFWPTDGWQPASHDLELGDWVFWKWHQTKTALRRIFKKTYVYSPASSSYTWQQNLQPL